MRVLTTRNGIMRALPFAGSIISGNQPLVSFEQRGKGDRRGAAELQRVAAGDADPDDRDARASRLRDDGGGSFRRRRRDIAALVLAEEDGVLGPVRARPSRRRRPPSPSRRAPPRGRRPTGPGRR